MHVEILRGSHNKKMFLIKGSEKSNPDFCHSKKRFFLCPSPSALKAYKFRKKYKFIIKKCYIILCAYFHTIKYTKIVSNYKKKLS